jgi:hypothetical protein
MDDDPSVRLASNEGVFREVNEGIERGQWPGEPDTPVGFRCECARLGCNLLVTLMLPEYEQIRANPRHFVMIRGHELPEVERVVAGTSAYVVVEKIGEPGEEARAGDPRSD